MAIDVEKITQQILGLLKDIKKDNKRDEVVRLQKLLSLTLANNCLQSLDLACNKISDDGVNDLSKALETNINLQSLNLGYCNVSDAGAYALSKALKINLSLKYLNLEGNPITSDGFRSLNQVFLTNTSLQSLVLSQEMLDNTNKRDISIKIKINISATIGMTLAYVQWYLQDLIELDTKALDYIEQLSRAIEAMTSKNIVLLKESLTNGEIASRGVLDLDRSTCHQVPTLDPSPAVYKMLWSRDKMFALDWESGDFHPIIELDLRYKQFVKNVDLEFIEYSRIHPPVSLGPRYFQFIEDVDVKLIVNSLKTSLQLRQLLLAGNKIGDEGVIDLAELLKNNSTLEILDLRDNPITDKGIQVLANALKINTSLKTLMIEGKKNIKCVFVGDGACGAKTSIIFWYMTGKLFQHYLPTVSDAYCFSVRINNRPYYLSLHDTAGQEEYDRLRPLSYPGTDVFVIGFSVTSRTSFENVKIKWFPEIMHYCPNAQMIVVGHKIDSRNNQELIDRISERGEKLITTEEGIKMAKSLGIKTYLETSAVTGEGMQELFNMIFNLSLENKEQLAKVKSWQKLRKKYNIDAFLERNAQHVSAKNKQEDVLTLPTHLELKEPKCLAFLKVRLEETCTLLEQYRAGRAMGVYFSEKEESVLSKALDYYKNYPGTLLTLGFRDILKRIKEQQNKLHSDSVTLFEKSALEGEVAAQYLLGTLYEGGQGVIRDDKQAMVWYQKATSRQHILAGQALQRLQQSSTSINSFANAVNPEQRSSQFSNISSLSQKEDQIRTSEKSLNVISSSTQAKRPSKISVMDEKGEMQISLSIPYNQLEFGRELGKGGFGIVYQGVWNFSEVAIKKLLITELTGEVLEGFKQEAAIMAGLRSQYIVQFYGVCLEPAKYSLVMEYAPKGSLYSLLHSKAEIDWMVRLQWAGDIGAGMAYLHSQKIIHRDLKSLNVLLDKTSQAKLTDFGLSKVKNETNSTTKTQSSAGSLLWMAPELFTEDVPRCDQKTDVYSYGITLWEIASRKVPFEKAFNPHIATVWVSQGKREEIPSDTPVPLAKLITWCWDQQKDKRPTIAQVVQELRQTLVSRRENNIVADEVDTNSSSITSYRGNLASVPIVDSFRGNLNSKK